MTQKQVYVVAGSLAVLIGVVVWGAQRWRIVESSADNSADIQATALSSTADPIELTQVGLPADDPEKVSATPRKGKKAVLEDGIQKDDQDVQYNKLNPLESSVILRKGTERAFTGEYTDLKDPGTYICKRCNAALYHSDDKFESHCGWPSFDAEIKGAVKSRRETDGTGRVEIVCNNCGGHLGHVFTGEGYTTKNTRHCVNSVSMIFIAKGKPLPAVIKREDVKRAKSRKPGEDKASEDASVGNKPAEDQVSKAKVDTDKVTDSTSASDPSIKKPGKDQ